MTEQEYRAYREEKWNYFFEVMNKHFDYDEDQERLLKLGFMKGLDTATKGGKFVVVDDEIVADVLANLPEDTQDRKDEVQRRISKLEKEYEVALRKLFAEDIRKELEKYKDNITEVLGEFPTQIYLDTYNESDDEGGSYPCLQSLHFMNEKGKYMYMYDVQVTITNWRGDKVEVEFEELMREYIGENYGRDEFPSIFGTTDLNTGERV